ncbi:MAG: hypothetical protein ACRD0U_14265 [Acidimicrobiales bacterium]
MAGHEPDPSLIAVLDDVAPELPGGIEITVAESLGPQLVAENRTSEVLEVLDASGRPFLRLGPDGVFGDIRTAAWYQSNSPGGAAAVPGGLDGTNEPLWARVSPEPAWGWFDERLHPPGGRGAEWAFEVRLGPTVHEVRGHIDARPAVLAVDARLLTGADELGTMKASVLPGSIPALFIESTAEEVTVLGSHGEPFARVGPMGVSVNRHSPTYLFDLRARDGVPEADVDPNAPPDWSVVAAVPRLAWLDERLRPPSEPGSTRWVVPVRVGTETVELEGITEAIEPGGEDRDMKPAIVALTAGLAAGGLAATLFLRRRRP